MKYSLLILIIFGITSQIARCADPRFSKPVYEQEDILHRTDHWAIELSSDANPLDIAEKHGHIYLGTMKYQPSVHLFQKKPDTIHGTTHPQHEESSEIVWFENQIARQRAKRSPTDPLYNSQWHLHYAPGSTANVNVEVVWSQNITGDGIVIAVVDDGLEYTHPDISSNYNAATSWDFNYNDNNPYPDTNNDDHGTSAAGVSAARDNAACGVGSAYRAKLAGIRLISRASTDAQEADALNYRWDVNAIYSNSWGPIDDGRRKEGPGRLATLALQNGVQQGRNGKGSIFVWAGGNGRRSSDNCNYDGWANSIYTISIGAVDNKGIQAWYSEPCSMLIATAPSSGSTLSITTTDLMGNRGTSTGDCTSSFGGTSSAAPLAAGIVALVLEVNPNLGWRDVQGVLITSSAVTDPDNSGWKTNGAGLRFNHNYGFGVIDAQSAVEAARGWTNLPTQRVKTVSLTVNQDIPENSWLHSTINVADSFTIEQVTLTFVATHQRRGDLAIQLISPSGTVSILAEKHGDQNVNYNWIFGSVFHWGESTAGTWTLSVNDEVAGKTGSLTSWTLTIYGH